MEVVDGCSKNGGQRWVGAFSLVKKKLSRKRLLSSSGEMVLVEVPSPIAAAFSLAEGQGEPDWRLTKTRYGTVLSIRWKRSPVVVEASTSQPRYSQGLNFRQRRSRRRQEKKRSSDAPESADGRPDRRLQDPAPSKPPQSEDRSRPGHALAEKHPADFRQLDPKEQPSDSSKPNGHGSKETTRDQKDSNNDAGAPWQPPWRGSIPAPEATPFRMDQILERLES